MNKYLIIFLPLLLACFIVAQENIDETKQYQSTLMNEYSSLLKKDSFNQERINQIESIAFENPYYDLRQWIALSYVTKSEIREFNSKNLKQAFEILHKSINENFFKSIPLAFYSLKHPDLQAERNELIDTLSKKVSMGYLSPVAITELYILDGDYASAIEALGPLRKKKLGLYLDTNTLEVMNVEQNSIAPFVQKGDKLIYINNEIISFNTISEILSKYKSGSQQEITFNRADKLITKKIIIPEDSLIFHTSPYILLYSSYANKDFNEKDAIEYINENDFKNQPSYAAYKGMVEAALCNYYSVDDLISNDIKGLQLCRDTLEPFISQFKSQNQTISNYEFNLEIGARTQYVLYKTSLHRIIRKANDLYYEVNENQDKELAVNLLTEYYPLFTNTTDSTYLWSSKILTEEHISGNLLDKNPKKAFEYSKDFFGQDERITKLLSSLVLDGDVDVSESFLNMLLGAESTKEFVNEYNLSSYVSYKAFGGLAPFKQQDINTACEYAANDLNINTNNISQSIYSYCVLSEEIQDNSKYINYIKGLSKNGSSEASWYLYHIEKDNNLSEPNYKELKKYLTLAKNQLSSNTSDSLVQDFFWLDDPMIFDVNKQYLNDDLNFVDSKIKEEEAFVIALQRTKDQKEKKRLTELRAKNRQEAMKKTGGFLVDVLEFTAKAILVVGVVALAGDALEDSSPEFQQAFADSLSSSVSGSGQSYSNNYSSYQCTNARNELSSARRKLGLSNNIMGNMSCSNVGGNCMTRLPRQCYNRAASCRAGDYTCTSRENTNYHNCQSQARSAVQNEKRSCEARKQQSINQCNTRVNNNNRSTANFELRSAQSKVNQYCY